MNRTLSIGLVVTFLLLAATLFGSNWAPHDLSEHAEVSYDVDANGEGTLTVPPAPPGYGYPFGTDKYGYDMMAKMLAGAPYTIFGSAAIALVRVAVGGTIGVLAGYYGRPSKRQRKGRLPLASLLNGIPIFIIVWMIMIGITMNPSASPFSMSLIIAIVLAIVGIPAVASAMKAKTLLVKEKAFILSAQAIGASRCTILRRHIWPHLKESFAILFVQEIVLALGLFGQLAIFNVFVGGTHQYFDPVEYATRTNEWSGLIAQARDSLFIHQWILLFPLAAYLVFILGFHLISVGLEQRYRQKYAKYSHL